MSMTMHAATSNVPSVTRVVPRGTGATAPQRRADRRGTGTASIEYRALHALVRSLAFVGGAIVRLMPFGAPSTSRDSLHVEARHIADSVVPFVFQVS